MLNVLIRLCSCLIPIKSLRKSFRNKYLKNKTPDWKAPLPNCKVGRFTYFGVGCCVDSSNTEIGSFCSIAGHVDIGKTEHPLDKLSTSPYFYLIDGLKEIENPQIINIPCKVGNDVWIGDYAFIKGGVTIGDGAVIGAHAVVTKDIPPYAIVVGNPAKIIKYRFSQDIIDKLLELQWWNLPDEEIAKLSFDDVYVAITQLESLRADKRPIERGY